MEDLPSLIVNFGILIVSGIAAVVAVVQARSALRDATDATNARNEAVAAQRASAEALSDANQIAREARDLLNKRDARATERHQVKWVPSWDMQRGVWLLGNHGPDTALAVRLTVEAPEIGRQVLPVEDELPMEKGVPVSFPMYAGQGMPRVHWSVDWRTPLGAERHKEDVWPQ